MNANTLLENFGILAEAPGGIDRVRELILNFAIRGSLVHQIAQEKSIEIEEEVGDYEVPKTWKWVKVSSVAEFVNGFSFKSEEYNTSGVGIVRMSDLKFGQISVRDMKRVPIEYLASLDENLRVVPGDLVIGMSGSIGKPCFNLTDETFLLNQRVGKFVPSRVDKSYLAIVLQTLENSFLDMAAGSGIKNLSTKQIKDSLLPLPPRAEQERIVARVDELMALCDQLEQKQKQRDNLRIATRKSAIDAISTAITPDELKTAWERIESNWDVIADTPASIDSLRELVLNFAIHGQLVSHNQADYSAKILVEESLAPSKKKNIAAEGNSKPSSFEIPPHWAWSTIAGMCDTQTGATPKVLNSDSQRTKIQYVTAADMLRMRAIENNFVPLSAAERSGRIASKDSVLFVGIGATIGKSCLIKSPATFNQQIHSATPRKMSADFLNLVIASGYFQKICKDRTSTTAIPILNKSKWETIGIPIPPLSEQGKIVEKTLQLFDLCDQLETVLKVRSEVAVRFARSVVSAA